jgi:mRNA interferase MazF
MARILRGDIYWADLEPVRGREQAGRRPVLVLSREVFNEGSGTIVALAITSQPQAAGYPLTYPLPERLLPKPSWVKIGQVRTLSTQRLGRKLGRLPEADVDRVVEGLLDIIGP